MLVRVREGVMRGDLHWMEQPEGIATYLIDTRDGLAIVDPGPTVCQEALASCIGAMGASFRDVRHVLLTHIHLDHAAFTGSLVRQEPRIRVYVHARGAPHLEDPSRLLASANRIYGDDMARLFGEFGAVPRDNLVVLEGGERLSLGTRRFLAGYTPGHAIHHLAYLDEHEGLVFTGDVAGECTQHDTPALPVTPPPDIDLESWRSSIDLMLSWRPEVLLLTHFGEVPDPRRHLEEMWSRLEDWAAQIREMVEDSSRSDDAHADAFEEAEWDRLTSGMPAEQARWVDHRSIRSSWFGLARYWRRRLTPPTTA